MADKKYTGLRFVFLGFIVAIFVAVLMCGVTIRNEIARFGQPSKKDGNTAGGTIIPNHPPRRYPAPSDVEQSPMTPVQQAAVVPPADAPQTFNPMDPSYLRFKSLQGSWQGKGMDDQGVWVFVVEMREKPPNSGQFTAFASFSKIISLPEQNAARLQGKAGLLRIFRDLRPQSMILTGEPSGDSISFRLQKTIGGTECPLTKLVLTQFGNTGLMAEWQFGTCRSGESQLMRGMQ